MAKNIITYPQITQVVYMEEYEQQRGKGSFPAHFTPGYQVAKKANEMASKVITHT